MPRIAPEQIDEFYRLKGEHSALHQLMVKMTAYEAAIRILARHDLMTEFASEITAITKSTP